MEYAGGRGCAGDRDLLPGEQASGECDHVGLGEVKEDQDGLRVRRDDSCQHRAAAATFYPASSIDSPALPARRVWPPGR